MSSLSTLAQKYDVLFCDVWGVIHNGTELYPAARAAISYFRETGGTVVLLSNASRPSILVAADLERLGMDPKSYDAIITSGDLARSFLSGRSGIAILDVGPGSARPICQELDVKFTGLQEADIAVTSGAFQDDDCTLAQLYPLLQEMLSRRLLLLCANPDVETRVGGKRVKCSGAVAQAYAEMSGPVLYTGKPDGGIFEAAFARVSQIRGAELLPRRVLVVGDSMETDIIGAHKHGFDSLFVMSGIHVEEFRGSRVAQLAALRRLFVGSGCMPTEIAWQLAW